MSKLAFNGVISGDGECFCFLVDRKTFVEIIKKEPKKYDKSHKKDYYKLYPDDVFKNILGSYSNREDLKISIEVEQ